MKYHYFQTHQRTSISPMISTPPKTASPLKMHCKSWERAGIRFHPVNLHCHHHKLNRNIWFYYFCKSSVSKSGMSTNGEIQRLSSGSLDLNICATGPLVGHPRTKLWIRNHRSQLLSPQSNFGQTTENSVMSQNIFSPFNKCEIPPQRREDLDLKSDLDVEEEVSKKAGVGLKETSAPHFHNIVVYTLCATSIVLVRYSGWWLNTLPSRVKATSSITKHCWIQQEWKRCPFYKRCLKRRESVKKKRHFHNIVVCIVCCYYCGGDDSMKYEEESGQV